MLTVLRNIGEIVSYFWKSLKERGGFSVSLAFDTLV